MSTRLYLAAISACSIVFVDSLTSSMVDTAFRAFMERYNKKYGSDNEFNLRKALYAETLEDIALINKEGKSYNFTVDVNEFADLSSEEFDDRMLCGPEVTSGGLDLQGIFTNECGEGPLDHAVSVVGYGKSPEGVEYWKILNSWGPTWGENGYGYIQRNDPRNPAGPCGIMRSPDLYPVFRDGLTPGTCVE